MDDYAENEYHRAKKRALYLLGEKDYCKKALSEKLLKNYSSETCEKVIADMIEFGYLDEERYARKYAAYLIKSKKHGLYKARFEMQQKGISKALTDEILGEYDKGDFIEEIVSLLQKKYSEKLNSPENIKKVVAAFARRGYSYGDIKTAIEQVRSDAFKEIDFTSDD